MSQTRRSGMPAQSGGVDGDSDVFIIKKRKAMVIRIETRNKKTMKIEIVMLMMKRIVMIKMIHMTYK